MNEVDFSEFNRRDFLKGGSMATLAAMLGGAELLAQTNAPQEESKAPSAKLKVAVVGLGAWGRELLTTLGRVPQADVAAICDTYPAALRRATSTAPSAAHAPDYKALLENKNIRAIIIATPTHLHKDIAVDALKAGKHVYCEAPLANTVDDARAIASAARGTPQLVFQSGLQLRCEAERRFLLPFIRSGALGQQIMARAQWHNKQSWRAVAPNPEREKALNWRLDKEVSLGLIGEFGCHALDQACWFLNARPVSVGAMGSVLFWKDGREVPDTVHAAFEFPGGVYFHYDATLANSFDAEYAVFYGSDSAIMIRQNKAGENKAWLFKEVDSPLLGWEVYAKKDVFYEETGIALVADASKPVPPQGQKAPEAQKTALSSALETFLHNAIDVDAATEDAKQALGDDADAIKEQVAKVQRRPSAGYLEGLQATVLATKANEALSSGQRVMLKPDWFELS
jgi:predicted dehydrogenase